MDYFHAEETKGSFTMKKEALRSNGTIMRVQTIKALRAGISAMGTPVKKGDKIVHLSSGRATGEVFTLTEQDLAKLRTSPVSKWTSPLNGWNKRLVAKQQRLFTQKNAKMDELMEAFRVARIKNPDLAWEEFAA